MSRPIDLKSMTVEEIMRELGMSRDEAEYLWATAHGQREDIVQAYDADGNPIPRPTDAPHVP